MVAEVARVELGVFVDLPRQEAGTERAERNEADSKLFEHGQDIVFRTAPEEGVFALQGGDWLHGVSFADGVYTRFRQAKVLHLALGDQFLHSAGNFLDRHIWIDAMLVEEIDVVGAQPLQAGLGRGLDVLGTAIGAGPRFPVSGSMSKPTFVAITICSRIGCNASPISSSFAKGP